MTVVDPKIILEQANARSDAYARLRNKQQTEPDQLKENKLTFEESTRSKVLAKLKQTSKPENMLAVAANAITEKALKELGTVLTEAETEMWFPTQETRTDLMKITSNLMDTDAWDGLLEKYKSGEIRVEEMRDFIILSHVAVTTEADPVAVVDRQVRDALKSRAGVKLVGTMVERFNTVLSEGMAALSEVLPLEYKPQVKLLSDGGAKTEADPEAPEQGDTAVAVFEQRQHGSLEIVTDDMKEQVIREFFAGDIIYDRAIPVSYEELVTKLANPDDYEFDTVRATILDAGMEQVDKALRRKDYKEGLEGKKFVLYTSWLSNIFDGFGGTHSDDRGVDKYRVIEDITHEQFLELMRLVKKRVGDFFDGRIEFAELVCRWKSRPQILAERQAKEAVSNSAHVGSDLDDFLKEATEGK